MTGRTTDFESAGEILGRLAAEHMARTNEKARPANEARRVAFMFGAVTAAILGLWAVELWMAYTQAGYGSVTGNDLHIYTDAASRLLSGGSWFLERQLHGSYELLNGDVLYPPVAALAFAPWLVLPLGLYLLVPLVGIAWLVWGWKPAPWAWPLIALCVLYPGTALKWNAGNPSIYVALFTGLGLRYGWPAALILLKPSMAPFALIGIRDRRWWLVAVLLAIGSIPFLGATLEWPRVVLDANGGGLWYSVQDIPMALIPVIAWAARRRLAEDVRPDAVLPG